MIKRYKQTEIEKITVPSIIPSNSGQFFSISSKFVHSFFPLWLALIINIKRRTNKKEQIKNALKKK